MIAVNRRRYMGGGTSLPYDAEIEYLESSGTQYIDIGIAPNSDTGAYASVVCLDETDIYFFGLRKDSGNTRWGAGHSTTFYYCYGNYGPSSTNDRILGAVAELYLNYLNDGKFIATDGYKTKQISLPSMGFTTSLNIVLFGNHYIDTVQKWNGRFYSFRLTQGDSIVMDLIPVRIGQVGYLYDKIGGNLYGNAGTGDFILGRDKPSNLPQGYMIDTALAPESREKMVDANGFCVTIYLRLSAYTRSVTFDCGFLGADYSNAYAAIKVYDSSDSLYDYWGATTRPRTVSLSRDTWGIKATFFIQNLEQCYIYDETNQKYLFRYGRTIDE